MMLYKNKAWIVALTPLALSACTALDSSSDFSNSIASVDTQLNHVQVTGKEYKPEFKAIKGPSILKSSLNFVDNYPLNNNVTSSSYIAMNVSYFQSYDEYKTVTYNGQQFPLKRTLQSTSSCNEHCTATQYFTFPMSPENISLASAKGLDFTLVSSNSTMTTEFSVPAGYIDTVHKTAQANANKAPTVAVTAAPQTTQVVATSKAEEMVQYWYAEATPQQQQAFSTWAFENRTDITTQLKSDAKPTEMMSYWYEKSSKEEKIAILKWLLEQ
ncbi:hypothetical protein A9264_12185 [Vibrio sp. UCD-FRSSP16_10]|uniref:DUF2057 family protein n=1 Tax=unclassified Vibrio TaxID=2614977 RepID=UPI000801BEA0|nr:MULTISPECIES: DUF2057 family protein [unclassified Vibrio]OBT16016.1 hypothetical protein A9260_12400 [Vibrio sp. UCD-FRSSP16_30]OBT21098.1 hypothetical protein A9264_12185 [Vibrio sp. UCD-FRSSP16_10]